MYGQGNKAAMPKGVANGQKNGDKKPMSKGNGDMKKNGGMCYTHDRKSGQK